MRMMTMAGVALLMAVAIGCSKPAATTTNTTVAPARAQVAFTTDPATPKVGENSFAAMLMQDGKPVDDAQVSVEFEMPAMPQMKMAEMKTTTDLAPTGGGMYRAKGQVMMAGTWNVTVRAMRNGQELATQKLSLIAQ